MKYPGDMKPVFRFERPDGVGGSYYKTERCGCGVSFLDENGESFETLQPAIVRCTKHAKKQVKK